MDLGALGRPLARLDDARHVREHDLGDAGGVGDGDPDALTVPGRDRLLRRTKEDAETSPPRISGSTACARARRGECDPLDKSKVVYILTSVDMRRWKMSSWLRNGTELGVELRNRRAKACDQPLLAALRLGAPV
jgi:hypothetical protein